MKKDAITYEIHNTATRDKNNMWKWKIVIMNKRDHIQFWLWKFQEDMGKQKIEIHTIIAIYLNALINFEQVSGN